VMDSSGKNFFLGIEVFKLFCGFCLWFRSKVVWVLWVVGVPPAEIAVVDCVETYYCLRRAVGNDLMFEVEVIDPKDDQRDMAKED